MREAAGKGAKVVLPPELFEGPYFCRTEDEAPVRRRAKPADAHPAVLAMRALAAELGIYIPTSFFEADGPHHYNSLAMIDDKGAVMGVYRKSHIPDGPGYSEKFYFRPGNSGFKTWPTPAATLGVGICWDQWYPETARALMLMGAEILLLPDRDRHRAARPRSRHLPAVAPGDDRPCGVERRPGRRRQPDRRPNAASVFYGHSFICDERGDILAEFGATETGVLTATLDLGRGQAPPRRLRLLPRPPAGALRAAHRGYLKRSER